MPRLLGGGVQIEHSHWSLTPSCTLALESQIEQSTRIWRKWSEGREKWGSVPPESVPIMYEGQTIQRNKQKCEAIARTF